MTLVAKRLVKKLGESIGKALNYYRALLPESQPGGDAARRVLAALRDVRHRLGDEFSMTFEVRLTTQKPTVAIFNAIANDVYDAWIRALEVEHALTAVVQLSNGQTATARELESRISDCLVVVEDITAAFEQLGLARQSTRGSLRYRMLSSGRGWLVLLAGLVMLFSLSYIQRTSLKWEIDDQEIALVNAIEDGATLVNTAGAGLDSLRSALPTTPTNLAKLESEKAAIEDALISLNALSVSSLETLTRMETFVAEHGIGLQPERVSAMRRAHALQHVANGHELELLQATTPDTSIAVWNKWIATAQRGSAFSRSARNQLRNAVEAGDSSKYEALKNDVQGWEYGGAFLRNTVLGRDQFEYAYTFARAVAYVLIAFGTLLILSAIFGLGDAKDLVGRLDASSLGPILPLLAPATLVASLAGGYVVADHKAKEPITPKMSVADSTTLAELHRNVQDLKATLKMVQDTTFDISQRAQ